MRADRVLLKIHRWTGLIGGAVLALIGATGSLLVFWQEIDRSLFPEAHRVEARGPASLGVTFAAAREALPVAELVWIEPHVGSASRVYLRREESPRTYDVLLVDPHTGEIRARRRFGDDMTVADGPVEWLYMLHFTLTAGPWGRTAVAWMAVLLLVSSGTGAWVYRKRLSRALTLRVPLRATTWAGTLSNVHRVTGSFALVTNLLLAATGLWMLRGDLVGLRPEPKPHVPAPVIAADAIDAAVKRVADEHPTLAVHGLTVQDVEGAVHVGVWGTYPEDRFWLGETASGVTVDAADLRTVEVHLGHEHDLGEQLDHAAAVLHFGHWGGLPVRLLYVLAGVAVPALSLSGLATWALRLLRVRARRAAPLRKVA